jgi:hypothetical protein
MSVTLNFSKRAFCYFWASLTWFFCSWFAQLIELHNYIIVYAHHQVALSRVEFLNYLFYFWTGINPMKKITFCIYFNKLDIYTNVYLYPRFWNIDVSWYPCIAYWIHIQVSELPISVGCRLSLSSIRFGVGNGWRCPFGCVSLGFLCLLVYAASLGFFGYFCC